MTLSLPVRPSLSYLRKQAKYLLKRQQARNPEVCSILRRLHRFSQASDEDIFSAELTLAEVQFALAMEYGFTDWSDLKRHVESLEIPAIETYSTPAVGEAAPWPEVRQAIIAEAVALGASDTLLEWKQGRLMVRQRVDGLLLPSKIVVGEDQGNFVMDGFKLLGAMDTAVHDETQNGQCVCELEGKPYRMYISVVPYTSGESLVMRTRINKPNLYDLDAQGWLTEDLGRLRQWIRRPRGLIIVAGPSRSGKTTTIYGLLRELVKRGDCKISTAENPVEFPLDGVLQQQVGPSDEVSYAQAILTQMRQEADIIMAGECKDAETLDALLDAAGRGHLVLTAMHANDAAVCLRRLMDLKNTPYRIADSVIGIVAQRLLHRICENCRELYEPPAWVRQSLPEMPVDTLYHGKGCDACRNSGYHGMSVISEMLEVDDAFRMLIARNASVDEFRKQFAASGARSLRAAGFAAAAEGITTVEEVLRTWPD